MAELKTTSDVDKPDPAAATLTEYKETVGDPHSPAPFGLGVLHSPLPQAGSSGLAGV